MTDKEKFIEIFKTNISRQGSDTLLNYLETSDFFDAPASSRFHSNFNGGLCHHSINAYYRFVKNLEMEYGKNWEEKISKESVAIIALLHDICKTNFYKVDYRNIKVDGNWVQKPYYSVEDSLPYGHGEKSVYILSGFMKLTREEAMAINWHMGGMDDRVKGGSYSLAPAFYNYPAALLFHISDMQATYLDEKISDN
ncbi:MAG: hydrolase [Clostridia bacterium]|nr:hydrolase [Clostridia bacterium]